MTEGSIFYQKQRFLHTIRSESVCLLSEVLPDRPACFPLEREAAAASNSLFKIENLLQLSCPCCIIQTKRKPSVYKGRHAFQRPEPALASSSSLVGVSPPASSSSPAPVDARRKVLRSFSGAEMAAQQGRRSSRAVARQRG